MSWDQKTKASFRIAIVMPDLQLSTQLKKNLSVAGFDAYLLPDDDVLMDRIQKDPPHIVAVHPQALGRPIEKLLEQCEKINAEVQFILVGPAVEHMAAKNFFLHNVAGNVEAHLPSVALAIEGLAQRLFVQYQNEQLFLDLGLQKAKVEKLLQKNQELQQQPKEVLGFHVGEEIKLLQTAESTEDLLHRYFERLKDLTSPRASAAFFKYFKAQNSLIPVQASGMDLVQLRGLGIPLTGSADPKHGEVLRAFMKDVLRVQDFWSFPFTSLGEFDGHLVVWCDEPIAFPLVENLSHVLQMVLDQKAGVKSKQSQQWVEPNTQFLAISQKAPRISAEMARAQRHKQALSLLRVRLDQPHLLEKVSELVRKSSRPSDLIFYRSKSEFDILLPHTTHHGARTRAERLRLAVEKSSRTLWGQEANLSIGIAEYPALARNATDLELLAENALQKAVAAGGNGVSVAPVASGWKPDFATSV